MKVTINIPGAVYVSGAAEVVNRKAFSRLESQHGFEYALSMLFSKNRKLLN